MIVRLLTEHHLEFLSLKGGCRGSSESTLSLVKMSNCWKSHAAAQFSVSLTRSTRNRLRDCFVLILIKGLLSQGSKWVLLYNRTS